MYVCVLIKLHITALPGPVKLIFECYNRGSALWKIWSHVRSCEINAPLTHPRAKRVGQRALELFHFRVAQAIDDHRGGGGGGAYSIVACLSRMTIGHASLARPTREGRREGVSNQPTQPPLPAHPHVIIKNMQFSHVTHSVKRSKT